MRTTRPRRRELASARIGANRPARCASPGRAIRGGMCGARRAYDGVLRIGWCVCASAAIFACTGERPRRAEPIVDDLERVPARVSSLDALTRCTSEDVREYGAELSTTFDESASVVSTVEGRFEVHVEQDGHVLPIREHEIALKRAPFDLVLTLPLHHGVYVSTSTHTAVFDAARRGQPLLRHFRSTAVVAEEWRDADEDLWLDEEPFVYGSVDAQGAWAWGCTSPWTTLQYLYYVDREENRFSAVQLERRSMIARRRVAAVKRAIETLGKGRLRNDQEAYVDQPLRDVLADSLYLVLLEDPVACDASIPAEREACERKTPLERRYLRLRFVE